jgi:FlaA1/EpsC-like NDP-sugar epimerase
MWRQFRNVKIHVMVMADLTLFAASLLVAFLLRLDFQLLPVYVAQLGTLLPLALGIKVVVFFAFGMYRGMWRYTSLKDIVHLLYASCLSTLVITAWLVFRQRFGDYSRAIILLDGVLTFLFTSGLRALIRMSLAYRPGGDSRGQWWWPRLRKRDGYRVMIVGAGDAGDKIFREIEDSPQSRYQIVCFIDDDSSKAGRTLHGLPIFGPIDRLADRVKSQAIQEVWIAIPSATGARMRRIVNLCEGAGVTFKTLPGLGAIIDGRVTIQALRHVDYEDLLGRSPVSLDTAGIEACLRGRRILVTGCGGSIGSELCRQIIKFHPAQLVLWESSEPDLYQIQMELQHERKFADYIPILGQIQQPGLLDSVFTRYRPEVVFHAAAYKHVPLLEQNPWNAVTNNIGASELLMSAAARFAVDRFVLVSTDKAVRPTNVMGASKRIIEIIMQSMAGGPTRFMAVRFGNVLGSAGSVIPLFQRQIERGGPVTVTHPDVTRFFMTIPEAAQLILQAGSMGNGGELFILDMGTPIKIIDMARDLIRLSGKEPDRDILIEFTGLRPGEKLYEELITEGEGIVATHHNKIRVIQPSAESVAKATLALKHLPELHAAAVLHDGIQIRHALKQLAPEYMPEPSTSVLDPA